MGAFIAARYSSQQRAASASAVRRFDEFCAASPRSTSSDAALLDAYLAFLLQLFEVDELQAASVDAVARALALGLRLDGRARVDLYHTPAAVSFRRVATQRRPVRARLTGTMPYNPAQLLDGLDMGDSFNAIRDRALVLLRLETLIRPGQEPSRVRRSTIVEQRDPLGRTIVTFEYASKPTQRAHLAADTNYVSHICRREGPLPAGSVYAACEHCPACCVLELRDVLAAPDVAPRIADHDALFTSVDGEPLSTDRCRTIVGDVMRRAGIAPAFTPHSLRNAVNNMLTLRGISHEDICVRAGWATSTSGSRARIKHYNHFHLVGPNFARVLLIDSRVPGTAIQPEADCSANDE